MYTLDLQTSIPSAGHFDVNTIKVSDELTPWKGKYYKDLPLSLTAHANEGYRFIGWEHTNDVLSNTILNPFSDTTVIALFEVMNNSEFDVVINEISYSQIDEYKSGDWIEFYNNSGETIDLTNWTFEDSSTDNDAFLFPPNTKFEPRQYIVLVKNKDAFKVVYPNVESIYGNLNFGLSKNGESLKLYDNSGNIVDFVNYKPDGPWPILNASNSINLIDVELNNNQGASWKESDIIKGSPGFDNTGLATNLITEFLESDLVKVFPNPTNGFINIDVTSNGVIKIYDLAGRLIITFSISKGTHNLDFSEYDKGSYIVKFMTALGEESAVLFINE
jgi:hypothetical protein